ncbi:hypothetical protein ACFYVR_20675 [Rhodococcus sp. NPDC003318]
MGTAPADSVLSDAAVVSDTTTAVAVNAALCAVTALVVGLFVRPRPTQ